MLLLLLVGPVLLAQVTVEIVMAAVAAVAAVLLFTIGYKE
jgi:hypothetical protein